MTAGMTIAVGLQVQSHAPSMVKMQQGTPIGASGGMEGMSVVHGRPLSAASKSTKPALSEGFNVVEFLSSAEGRRAYSFWEKGVLTDAKLVRDYGSAVWDASQIDGSFSD